MVQKKRTSHHFFHLKTAGTVGIWQRHGRSPTWTFYRLYGIHARCVYTPPLIDFCRCFICFQTITCRPVKASSILFGSNLQTQTCQEKKWSSLLHLLSGLFKTIFYSFTPGCPPKTIRKLKFFTSRKRRNSDVRVQDRLDKSAQKKLHINQIRSK